MLQPKEYDKLLGILETSAETKEVEGIRSVIKHIPDLHIAGDLDPRVLKVISSYTNHSEEEQTEPANVSIEAIRASMGWLNRDVTTTEITTELISIPSKEHNIPARIYRPISNGILPAVVFFHGGGFIGGSLKTVENPCKALAEKAQAAVVSVDYRLAPEHPFPAGLEDCLATVSWVHENAENLGINKEQLAVCGDSAGGNLAAVCSLLDSQQGTNRIKYQALIYPVVNPGRIDTEDHRWDINEYEVFHHHELIKGVILALAGSSSMLNKLYLQGADVTDIRVSPLLADDLNGLPETLIINAEYDYLRLQAEAYARKLARSGVKTKMIQYKGMDHAFIDKIGDYPQAEDCINEIAKELKSAFRINC
ncbi:alpha/beta hydrolase [Priestia flexa]|uniref:alpha/beta hydrolase n=1 Tax=Priestia flexa TaxID=86664 RepID=UPI003D2F22B1